VWGGQGYIDLVQAKNQEIIVVGMPFDYAFDWKCQISVPRIRVFVAFQTLVTLTSHQRSRPEISPPLLRVMTVFYFV
jgi:hypothetical protein